MVVLIFHYNALNVINIDATNTTNAKLNGKYDFHNSCINWSYLILGNVALTHINTNTKNAVLIPNQNPGDSGNIPNPQNGNHPS